MSSYFDTMGMCALDSKYVAELVYRQCRWYIRKINQECLVKELDKVNKFFGALDEIREGKESPHDKVQMYHTLFHELGNADIHLRGNRRVTSSPEIPI